MASLYRRATPSQARILRIVEGAVKNAADAHHEIKISPQHRRSIAKRAAGTLSAQWPAVLAANMPSGSGEPAKVPSGHRQSSGFVMAAGRGEVRTPRRSPLGRLISVLTRDMRRVKAEESADYVRAMVDVLRIASSIRGQA